MTDQRVPDNNVPARASQGDFPFYDGRPIRIPAAQWALVLAACVVGFVVLIAPIAWGAADIIPALLFPAIPLAALYYVAREHWTAIFRRLRPRDIGLMFGFAVLNIIVTMVVGLVYKSAFDTADNPALDEVGDLSTAERIVFFIKTIPQLFGEELITILPLLAIMYLCYTQFSMSRKTALIVGWLATAVIFGLLHLPTYDWNLLQVLIIIGTARLILTIAYLVTKNILVSTGAHIINDWSLFGVALATA